MRGCFGRFLKDDLTAGQFEDLTIDKDDQEKYVGGSTMAARIIYDYVEPGMDPLASKNPLVFAAGPFTGSNVPMQPRSSWCL